MKANLDRATLILLSGLVAQCFVFNASAADSSGNVTQLSIAKDFGSYVFIKLDVPPATTPACSINGYWNYTLPLVSDTDRRMFAMLVTAHATQRTVLMRGAGVCSEFGSIESTLGVTLMP